VDECEEDKKEKWGEGRIRKRRRLDEDVNRM